MDVSKSELASRRVEMEHALKAAAMLQQDGRGWHSVELARNLGILDAQGEDMAAALIAAGWAAKGEPGPFHLTKRGQSRALELIRAHCLWERYLVDREGMPLDAGHSEAHHREHETAAEGLAELDAALGYLAWDPHGHPIPASDSHVPSRAGRSLLDLAIPGGRLRIVRLDDEPEALLGQLVVLGLEPGVEIEVATLGSECLALRMGDRPELPVVPPSYDAASHVFAVPAPASPVPMGDLEVGSRAHVVELTGSGKLQRRMLSMGFVPGAEVRVVREAPLGDPHQYRVKQTNVALRREEANTVLLDELHR
jgi:Fe2+ transport system protein FeoA/Mn-dependent DtxR family transcriptional regulator